MADDWEESIVYVELCGLTSTQLFPSEGSSQQAEILGLASERPLMQVNGHTFAGCYEDTVGTHLFMAEDTKNSTPGNEGGKSSAQSGSWQYLCKTDKKLVMQPAFLMEKGSQSSAAVEAFSADAGGEPLAEADSSAPEEGSTSEAAT